MRTRDWRRHQSKRVRNNFRRKWKDIEGPFYDSDWIDWYTKTNYNNRSPCSCYMCGNPRKHWGELTIQEKKAEITVEDIKEAIYLLDHYSK